MSKRPKLFVRSSLLHKFGALRVTPRNCTATVRIASTREAASSSRVTQAATDAVTGTNGAKLSIYRNSRQIHMSHSTPVGQIQFEEADPHTPVNSQRRLVTPPPVSSKVQRSGLVHIIGKDPPKIPNLFGDFATIVPDDDSQEQ